MMNYLTNNPIEYYKNNGIEFNPLSKKYFDQFTHRIQIQTLEHILGIELKARFSCQMSFEQEKIQQSKERLQKFISNINNKFEISEQYYRWIAEIEETLQPIPHRFRAWKNRHHRNTEPLHAYLSDPEMARRICMQHPTWIKSITGTVNQKHIDLLNTRHNLQVTNDLMFGNWRYRIKFNGSKELLAEYKNWMKDELQKMNCMKSDLEQWIYQLNKDGQRLRHSSLRRYQPKIYFKDGNDFSYMKLACENLIFDAIEYLPMMELLDDT